MPDTTHEAPDLRAFQGSQPVPEHTPGPWKARIQTSKAGRDLGWIIEHPNGRIGWASLAYADTNKEAGADDPAREANARLIAAAPELLAFVRDFLTDYQSEDGMYSMKHYAGKAHTAIAKYLGLHQ